jgi:hypothetical protein
MIRAASAYRALPARARVEDRRDRRGKLGDDPGIDRTVEAALNWLATAQDRSTSADGGVSRHFSLVTGWATSYPETTGYIVPTVLDMAAGDTALAARGRRMLDWLVSIQFPEGGFQGGVIGQVPLVPVTFNTGQILLGLVAGVRHFGQAYRAPMKAAAEWLGRTQDSDGCWRKYGTPFAAPGEKVYETHVSWGLFEAARLEPQASYADCAIRNIDWALSKQRPNGWFESNCLVDAVRPLTHTIGYALRGVVEAYLFTRVERFLDAALRCADGVLSAVRPDGMLPGRLDADWRGAASWVCLTGSVQIAHSWLLLYRETGERRFLDAAVTVNRYVRRTVRVDGPPEVRGGVKGSFPISGEYGRFEYLNWACKFFIDSNRLEGELSR